MARIVKGSHRFSHAHAFIHKWNVSVFALSVLIYRPGATEGRVVTAVGKQSAQDCYVNEYRDYFYYLQLGCCPNILIGFIQILRV